MTWKTQRGIGNGCTRRVLEGEEWVRSLLEHGFIKGPTPWSAYYQKPKELREFVRRYSPVAAAARNFDRDAVVLSMWELVMRLFVRLLRLTAATLADGDVYVIMRLRREVVRREPIRCWVARGTDGLDCVSQSLISAARDALIRLGGFPLAACCRAASVLE